jgi:predicted phage terminase large subunit-like protein
MNLTTSEYSALLRHDFYAFIERTFYQLHPAERFLPNWHLEVLAAELEACRQGRTRRLIINLPPRSLKSVAVSVAFAAYWLGHSPSARIICASYGQDLADKHARDCRAVFESDWYRRVFRTRLAPQKQSVAEFATTDQGFRMATSVGGVLTGRGAEVLILDDILKPEDALSDAQRRRANDWYSHTLYSRLNNKEEGVIIIVQQRLHEDDLVGHVLGREPWRIVRFPAIAEGDEEHHVETPYGRQRYVRRDGEALHEAREPRGVLDHIRRTIGEYNFAGQYQQAPAPLGGGLVKRDWFRTYGSGDLPERFDQVVQSWDTASKASELANYSVCTTWGRKGKHIYLLNVYRKQVDFPDLVRAVVEQQRQFRAHVILVEEAASGIQLIQQLKEQGIRSVKAVKPERDKVVRMHAQTPVIENGLVWVPREAHWLDAYLHELTTFPASKHSDQVDSTSQALAWIAAARGVDPEVMAAAMAQSLEFAERLDEERKRFFDQMHP